MLTNYAHCQAHLVDKFAHFKYIFLINFFILVVLQFEGSGKWPDDVEAIQYMKGAFYIQMATLLKANCSLTAHASSSFIDVFKVSYSMSLLFSKFYQLFEKTASS